MIDTRVTQNDYEDLANDLKQEIIPRPDPRDPEIRTLVRELFALKRKLAVAHADLESHIAQMKGYLKHPNRYIMLEAMLNFIPEDFWNE